MINKITLSTVLMASLATISSADIYYQNDIDKILKRVSILEKTIEENQIQYEDDIDALNERADENEFQATMNRIKWGGEFEVTDNFIDDTYNNQDYSNNNKLTTKLRLSMETKVNDKTKFIGRLSMFKNWSDSINNTFTDPAQGRKPNGSSSIYVERAYVDYTLNDIFSITLGRQPSSDGPGMTLIENTQRKSTYPALLFDGSADGVVATAKLSPNSATNPTFRVAYGKGFQSQSQYSPYTINTSDIDDLDVYGAFYEMSLPFGSMGNNLIVLSYVHATNFIGHPQYTTTPNNKNLGDMDLAGAYFENNKAFGSNFNYFASLAWNMPDANNNTVNFGPLTANQNVTLIQENGSAFHVGARYDFDIGIKLGYEFNHGSKYWYSFTNGSSDLLNKMATRGNVHETYAIYQVDLNQFIKVGYTSIKYDFTGSSWHIGTPIKSNDTTKRLYLTYNLRF